LQFKSPRSPKFNAIVAPASHIVTVDYLDIINGRKTTYVTVSIRKCSPAAALTRDPSLLLKFHR